VLTIKDITLILERLAPPELAEEWDNVGLQVGRFDREVSGVLLALDLTREVLEEAQKLHANLIVTHHPLIFKPLSNLRFDRPGGELWEALLAGGFNIYTLHTNYDRSPNGLNQYLAGQLGLKNTVPVEEGVEEFLKLVVFVPENYVDKVFSVLTNAGAGWIGNYSHCTFRTKGVGTFLPQEGTNPFIGEQGEIEQVNEVRLETIIPARNRNKVINALIAAHPYEEVAYDLYPVVQGGGRAGLGRFGTLPAKVQLEEFLAFIKGLFGGETIRWGGYQRQQVQRVAVIGGSGRKFINQVKRMGAELFITSDLGYHDFLLAEQIGLTLVEVGHHLIESCALESIREYLRQDPLLAKEEKQRIYISQSKIKPYSLF
jgi:dinuclear metal center YbgI/SA1388 family protein